MNNHASDAELRMIHVASTAAIVGSVALGPGSSVWYNAVLRGDPGTITIGTRTNIQDGCVLHADPEWPVVVGDDVSLGHAALIHGARIGDRTLIGMGSILLDGSVVGSDCVIAAGTLITQGMVIPDGSLVIGSPGAVRRPTTEAERASNRRNAIDYASHAARLLVGQQSAGRCS